MGAWIAGLFAQWHTDRAERTVLIDGGLPIELAHDKSTEEILEDVVGPAVARLEMIFDSPDAYFGFWRQHPALKGWWHPEMESILSYELHKVDGMWRVRANMEAILQGGADFALDEEANAAATNTPVPSTLVFVDHGLLGEPGGFIPVDTAQRAAASNPNITLQMLERLNHYTLVFGEGAAKVASVVASG
jgi:pimeloyl-ACP methyl ester carboxylesterase